MKRKTDGHAWDLIDSPKVRHAIAMQWWPSHGPNLGKDPQRLDSRSLSPSSIRTRLSRTASIYPYQIETDLSGGVEYNNGRVATPVTSENAIW